MHHGTQNFSNSELQKMQDIPNVNAIREGRTVPYYLQYIRDGKPNIKPKEKRGEKEGE